PAVVLPVHGAERRGRRAMRALPRRRLPHLQAHGLARGARLRHGAPVGARRRRRRQRALHRLRVRHGRRPLRYAALRRIRPALVLRERSAVPGAVPMKQSVAWLRELASPPVDDATLARRLTLAGIMVDAVSPAAPPLGGIVVGRIVACEPHPNADKLNVCDVDTGGTTHRIVCGASNARVGLVAPVALPGTTLPGGVTIEAARLRGVSSDGMLCSGRELGLSDDHEGLLELP